VKEHFSFKLGVLLFLVTLTVMSLFVGLRYAQSYKAFEENVIESASIIAQRVADQVGPSIWEVYLSSVNRQFSEKATSAVLTSEMKNDFIDAIVVYGRFGHVYMGMIIDEYGDIAPYVEKKHQAVLFEHESTLDHPIKNGSMSIGKVTIYYNDQPLRAQLAKTVQIEVLQVLFVTLFIICLLYFTIKYVLIKPLESLDIAKSTINGLGEGVLYTDSAGRVLNVNPAFLKMTGYKLDEVLNEECDVFILPDSTKSFLEQVDLALSYGKKWSGEVVCRKSDGPSFPVFLNASEVYSEELKVLCRVFIFQDISSQKKAEMQLRDMAYKDVLTDLPNRRKFELMIDEQITFCERTKREFGLLFIDLDGFKYINDVLGHAEGDKLLVQIAKRFASRLRAGDYIARLGGDEFVVIASAVDSPQGYARLAEDLIQIAHECVVLRGEEHRVGATIGICVYPKDGTDIDMLLNNADHAMYQGKQSGKGRYEFYAPDVGEKVQFRQRIKGLLVSAIHNREFHLLYQPKLDLADSNKVIGIEALVRWNTQEYGFISPDDFIPVAETSSAILEIGQIVIEEAFAMAHRLNKGSRSELIVVAINLSAHQLKSDMLVPFISSMLRVLDVNPEWVEFEITETAVIDDFDESIETLSKLKELGFCLSLDDFGTGYSSLSVLTKLPIDVLKIDKTFVFDIGENRRSESVVETIIALSKSLDLQVIAEGIENKGQLEFLVDQGCDYGQGFYFSKPVSAEAILSYIANSQDQSGGKSHRDGQRNVLNFPDKSGDSNPT
jgi:diguanylate cyclase (GGDEF)-like protein/PAS domain S-box-containing protein